MYMKVGLFLTDAVPSKLWFLLSLWRINLLRLGVKWISSLRNLIFYDKCSIRVFLNTFSLKICSLGRFFVRLIHFLSDIGILSFRRLNEMFDSFPDRTLIHEARISDLHTSVVSFFCSSWQEKSNFQLHNIFVYINRPILYIHCQWKN